MLRWSKVRWSSRNVIALQEACYQIRRLFRRKLGTESCPCPVAMVIRRLEVDFPFPVPDRLCIREKVVQYWRKLTKR
jgi:hypothetical protein